MPSPEFQEDPCLRCGQRHLFERCADEIKSEFLPILEGSVRPCPKCGGPDRTWEWTHAGTESYCKITCRGCGFVDKFGPI